MKSNFLGPAYKLRSLPLSAQTCINLYMEPDETTPGEGAFYGTPGLLLKATLATSGCRGLHVAGGFLWAVYGNKLYKITSGWTATAIGTLPNSTGHVEIFDNGTDLIVAHQDGWHTCLVSGGSLSAVSGSEGTSDGTFIDSYFVQAKEDGTYQWADVGTTTIDALSFASAEGAPDKIIRTIADHRELLLLGENTIEVAVVTSDPDLPFTRTAFIEQGVLAKHSVTKEDNSVFWLGKNERGQGVLYRADGYVPTRISTFAIEQAIAGYAAPEDAVAYTYQQGGHHFYVIHFAEASWCYDINTGLWSQRAYRDPTTGDLERHRGGEHAFFNGVHVVGDYEDGRLYALDLDTYTDDDDAIYRERIWAQIEAEGHRMLFHKGELRAAMGVGLDGDPDVGPNPPDWAVDPQIWLSWSDDGGRTWSNQYARSLGRIGEFRTRAIWRRLGTTRNRYFKLWTSAPVPIALMGFNIDMEVV
jgi:hypothetical protein